MLQRALLLSLALLISGPATAGWRDRTNNDQATVIDLRHNGEQRRYALYIPPGLDPDKPAALVLAFHGGGGHAEFMVDDARYGLIGKAREAGFVVAFPNGHSRFPRGRLATWNAGGCCGNARDSNSDDVGFTRAVVADIGRRVAIDRQRIFATGMSNGGMMAYRLACEAADLVRAVAAVAGTEAVADCRPSRPVPILHIHARNDTHVLFDGGAGPEAFRDTSKVMDFVSVPETVRRWVSRNACRTTPERVLAHPGAWCERYSGCRDEATVELCVTSDGGHSWPGADSVRRGKEGASQALDASDTIWAFFSEVADGRR